MAMEHQHFVRGGLEPERKIMSRKKNWHHISVFLEATISGTMVATCCRLGVGDNAPPIYLLLHPVASELMILFQEYVSNLRLTNY
jgi:hypothetical protein